MLPNFLIIGAQKSGTSWLSECLREHPDVYISEQKEIYFFSDYDDMGSSASSVLGEQKSHSKHAHMASWV